MRLTRGLLEAYQSLTRALLEPDAIALLRLDGIYILVYVYEPLSLSYWYIYIYIYIYIFRYSDRIQAIDQWPLRC